MAQSNRTPCKSLPNTATKEELKLSHSAKMNLKTAHNKSRPKDYYRGVTRGNLSRRHPNNGKHPSEAYQ
jgi:hypothetical protein